MTPLLIGPLGVPELLIILAVVLLLFGGSRLAGIGKSTGRAIKEFKSETRGLNQGEKDSQATPPVEIDEPDYRQPASGSTAADASTSDSRRDV